jgi:arsenite-transporting ATPase
VAARGAPPKNDDTTARPTRPHPSAAATIHPARHAAPPVRRLTIVGGKGGVGKTTAACAIAIAAASPEAPVLVVSTDPAPSVADALDHPVADEDTPVPDAPGLMARQMDAAAAFDRLKRDYEARIDAVFDGLLGQGMDATHDRAILRDLLSLAPPGIDELYALALLGEMLGERRFATIVVDPAPTGHLLRLLEMPALALDWSHRLMRLMLKYREVAGLGDAAGEVLSFTRRTRALGELLADPAQAGLIVVALDEPLVRAESERLVAAVRAHGVDVPGVLWNRVDRPPRPLPVHPPVPQFVAAATEPPPRGVAALRRWHAGWTSLAPTDG